jgi:hypothetical protein
LMSVSMSELVDRLVSMISYNMWYVDSKSLGQERKAERCGKDQLTGAAISTAVRKIAVSSRDTVRVIEMDDIKEVVALIKADSGSGTVNGLSFSLDGRILSFVTNRYIMILMIFSIQICS